MEKKWVFTNERREDWGLKMGGNKMGVGIHAFICRDMSVRESRV